MSTPTPARVPPNFPGRRVPLGPRMSRRSGGALAVGLAILGALAHRVGAKDSSHTMASVADGASVIKATTHSQGALWVKVPAARVAEDSPCKAQDCYAVCATLPADVRGEILPNTQCERGWDQPKGLGGYPVATSKAPPPNPLSRQPRRRTARPHRPCTPHGESAPRSLATPPASHLLSPLSAGQARSPLNARLAPSPVPLPRRRRSARPLRQLAGVHPLLS